MAAATITERGLPVMAEENVRLTASDGETFVTKLSKIHNFHVSAGEDFGASTLPSASFSGRTITIHMDAVSDLLVNLTVKGKL